MYKEYVKELKIYLMNGARVGNQIEKEKRYNKKYVELTWVFSDSFMKERS